MAINYSNLGFIKYTYNDIDSAWFYYNKSMEYNKLAEGGARRGLVPPQFGELL